MSLSGAMPWLLAIVAGVVVVMLAIRLGGRAMRGAKNSPPGAGALGWALLFLTSGRMPPPPPASVIQQELNGEKDRLGADPARGRELPNERSQT